MAKHFELALLQLMQNWQEEGFPDHDVWQGEIDMAVTADKLGYDSVWTVEHHFEGYGMCGDNMQYLSHIAALTKNINVVPGACILPWNDPLRVVEKMAMLEHVAPGRVKLGVGRGLAKVEYTGMRQDMNESRGRFDEAAEIILRGLDTGIVESDGEFYKQPRVEVRPKPMRGYRDDLYCVAMSPDSALAAARIGARMMTFIQYDFENHMPQITAWREEFARLHPDRVVPPPMLTDVTICHEDEEEARRLAELYISDHFASVMQHYDFGGDHFKDIKGYESYQVGADAIQAAGLADAQRAYIEAQNWGTPEQIIDKYRARMEVCGEFQPMVSLWYSKMPLEVAKNSLRLFAEKVMPEARKLVTNNGRPVAAD